MRGRLFRWAAAIALCLLPGAVNTGVAQTGLPAQSSTSTEARKLNSSETTDVPDFHLTQVQLQATVETDRIRLEAVVEVSINRGEHWHRIPLRMGQAHLWRREHSGPGDDAPDAAAPNEEDGLFWLLRGVGKHQLRLYAWIPIRRTVSGGQFQLSLPPLPPQFESRMTVRIPEPNAAIRPTRGMTLLETVHAADHTRIDVSVAGSRLEFAWQSSAKTADAISQVISRMHLRPAGEHLSLVVEQTIESQQSGLDQLLVRVPREFRLVRLLGSHYRSHEPMPDRPDWIRVFVTPDNVGRMTLRWDLERSLTDLSRPLVLDGFEVANALREEGLIRIDEFENARMIPRAEPSDLVHRISISHVRDWGPGVPLTAYEYLKQPFRLKFEIQPVATYVSVDPLYDLNVGEDELELAVRSPMKIDQGQPTELKLHWPGWEQQGWRLISTSANLPLAGSVTGDVASEPDTILLSWKNPVNQDLSLQAVFRKPVSRSSGEHLSLTLPAPQASRIGPSILTLRSADALEVQLTGPDGSLLPELPVPAISNADGAVVDGSHPLPQFRVAPGTPMQVVVIPHQREVTASTSLAVLSATPADLTVEQLIEFQVRYGRLSRVDLVLPEPLSAIIPPSAAAESLEVWLVGERLPLISSGGVLRATLPVPAKGSFQVRIRFRYPIDPSQLEQMVDLPVISLDGIGYQRTACLIEPVESVQVRSGNHGWEAVRTSPRGAMWIQSQVAEPVRSVPLSIGQRLSENTLQYVVQQLWISSAYHPQGDLEGWMTFHVESPPRRIVIQFPPGSEFRECLVNGEPLENGATTHRSAEAEELTLILPANASRDLSVMVRYRTAGTGPFRLTQSHSLALPRFPPGVWIEESFWELQLPPGQHLFQSPALISGSEWTRHGISWRREPTADYLQARSEMFRTAGTVSAVSDGVFAVPTGIYPFRSFGPMDVVTFRSMSRSLLLLLGAGFTLLLGYLVWKVPATRNAFVASLLAAAFALAGLWYLEPLQVLLQPAAVGLLLALTATGLDAWRRKPPEDRSPSRQKIRYVFPADGVATPSGTTRVYRPVPAGRGHADQD